MLIGPLPAPSPRPLISAQAMGAATNIAESRAGGRAGGVSEPVLESDTNIRLDKSLSAYGFLTTLIAVSVRILDV